MQPAANLEGISKPLLIIDGAGQLKTIDALRQRKSRRHKRASSLN
jgi:hypothetical protein